MGTIGAGLVGEPQTGHQRLDLDLARLGEKLLKPHRRKLLTPQTNRLGWQPMNFKALDRGELTAVTALGALMVTLGAA
ncbi:MAG: hypothetical protein ACR2NR_07635 [Solirubrobacteraceae bacterium]